MTYEIREPSYDGVSEERWVEPDWDEVADGDPESVADHFLACEGGFPPDTLEDLALAVVQADGRLNRNALADAVYGPDSAGGLDVDEETEEEVRELVVRLLATEFESMPASRAAVDDALLAWWQHRQDRSHEIEQKQTTDDEARYHEVKEIREDRHDRPEKGR